MKLSEIKKYWRIKRKQRTEALIVALASNARRVVQGRKCLLGQPTDPAVRIEIITRELQRRERDTDQRIENHNGLQDQA